MAEVPNLIKNLMRSSSLERGGMAAVSKAAQVATNMLGVAGEKVLKYAQPLAWGIAGSLAIATALSTPLSTIGPGANLDVPNVSKQPGKAADRMNTEDMAVESPALGNPTVPRMFHQNRTTIGPPLGSRVRVSATSRGQFNARTFGRGLSTIGSGSVNLNIRDNRNSASQHVMLNKLMR
jgi:hypothetical protein